MGCSCGAGKRNVNPDSFQKLGLLARHAYSVLDVVQEGEHRFDFQELFRNFGSFNFRLYRFLYRCRISHIFKATSVAKSMGIVCVEWEVEQELVWMA